MATVDPGKKRRAVITGLGPLSPAGIGKHAFKKALEDARPSLRLLDFAGNSTRPGRLGGILPDFHPKDYMDYKPIRHCDRLSQMAITASWLALEDAGLLSMDEAEMARTGIVLGTGHGNTEETEEYLTGLFRKGPRLASPILFPNTVMNAPASYVSLYFGMRGPNLTFNHLAISGETAVGFGADLIREGKADVVLAGGMDELGSNLLNSMEHRELLSPLDDGRQGIWPYDRKANGLCLGEGAGVIVLETLSHALNRSAGIYAEVEAYRIAASGGEIERRHWNGDGLQRALAQVLEGVKIEPDAIDGVIGSGCGHPVYDNIELDALRQVFYGLDRGPFLYSPKSLMGAFEGIGGLKIIVGALALSGQKAWPNRFLSGPADHGSLELPSRAESRRLRRVLAVAMSEGGAGLALLLRKTEEGR
jgi:3-oxoacyl-[acyl-carrier-protein] synthase II